jgi:hypothetical protein
MARARHLPQGRRHAVGQQLHHGQGDGGGDDRPEQEGNAEMEADDAYQRAHADGSDDHDAQLELDRGQAVQRPHASAAA